MSDPLSPPPIIDPPPPTSTQDAQEPRNYRLSRQRVAQILTLYDGTRTQVEVAQIVGVSQPYVHEVLRDFQDTRWLARRTLKNGAIKLSQRVINDATPKDAIRVLEDLKVLTPPQEGQPSRVNILVLGARDTPALSPPTEALTVTAVPVSDAEARRKS